MERCEYKLPDGSTCGEQTNCSIKHLGVLHFFCKNHEQVGADDVLGKVTKRPRVTKFKLNQQVRKVGETEILAVKGLKDGEEMQYQVQGLKNPSTLKWVPESGLEAVTTTDVTSRDAKEISTPPKKD